MNMEIRLSGTQSEMDKTQDVIRQQWQPINDVQLLVKESGADFRIIEVLIPDPPDKENVSLQNYWQEVVGSFWLRDSVEVGFKATGHSGIQIGCDVLGEVLGCVTPDMREALEVFCRVSRAKAGGVIGEREVNYCSGPFLRDDGKCSSWYADDNGGVCPKNKTKCSNWIEVRPEPDENTTTLKANRIEI